VSAVVLASDRLKVTITPDVGGTITGVEHRGLGASVLGTVPWLPETTPLDPDSVRDEPVWLTRFTGGWPLLFPNGCDACMHAGAFHGFHGEASITPWQAEATPSAVRMTRRFRTVPVEMVRELSVEDDVLAIRERVRMLGDAPVKVMWCQHATFGSDLLAGPFQIETGARSVLVDDRADPPTNPLRPGVSSRWPMVPGKDGAYDLSRPKGRVAAGACLHDFDAAWAAIRRLDNSVAAVLSWDAALYPYAWFWIELGGTMEAPWHGNGRVIGLEPSTTWPASGLAEAERRGGRLLSLQPGMEVKTVVRLHVFKPRGPVFGVNAAGRALFRA